MRGRRLRVAWPDDEAPAVRRVGRPRLPPPPDAPARQPAERVFAELRRAGEGQGYASLDEPVAAVGRALPALAAAPERVTAVAGGHGIAAAWAARPPGEEPQALELVA